MTRRALNTATAILSFLMLALIAPSARADIDVRSTGVDQAFNPTGGSYTVNLSLATNPGDPVQPGKGQYDPQRWAVVFNYTSVNIPSGTTVRFLNHPSGAPVVWLVSGDVTIAGQVILDGASHTGTAGLPTDMAPGGFRGGAGRISSVTRASGGYGPGGGNFKSGNAGAGGSYSTVGHSDGNTGPAAPTYNNPQVVPLIGGSGGAGTELDFHDGGGAGGGAILIAANRSIVVSGKISCRGGAGDGDESRASGGGSGGAVRLVADQVSGAGTLDATGGGGYAGGAGRIRIEGNSISSTLISTPAYTTGLPGAQPLIWPPSTAPQVQVTKFDNQPVPSDPHGSLDFPSQDVTTSNSGAIIVEIQAQNVPSTWKMTVRAVPKNGDVVTASATKTSGDDTSSVWNATLPGLPNGVATVQVLAQAPGQ